MTLDIEDIEDLTSEGVEDARASRTMPGYVSRARKHVVTIQETQYAPGIPGTQSIWVKTFGCAHNISDSEYMLGQLQDYGYRLVDDARKEQADLWLINTCTVKNPSQAAMGTVIKRGQELGKKLVVAGCVPQGDKKAKELQGLSLLGVSQIDRVVEAVEETLKGNTVQLLAKKTLPRLDLPKVRRNPHVEIVPLSTGCLGACTYCKTKHARGQLGSYDPSALVERVRTAAADPLVREIWLSSEDTGAYGRDIGTTLPALLHAMVAVLPPDGRTMLRVGMTNPPFILEYLKEIGEVLRHPCVFSYLHVPVQSGADPVLLAMNREYTVADFEVVADTLLAAVPGMELATDIICGFPGETEDDHAGTMRLLDKYRFPHCHISQFYARPGTPAARMKKVPSEVVKARSRAVTAAVESWRGVYEGLVGQRVRVWVTDHAADQRQLVGHTRSYCQVLLEDRPGLMGSVVEVQVTAASRWSVTGEVVAWVHRCENVHLDDEDESTPWEGGPPLNDSCNTNHPAHDARTSGSAAPAACSNGSCGCGSQDCGTGDCSTGTCGNVSSPAEPSGGDSSAATQNGGGPCGGDCTCYPPSPTPSPRSSSASANNKASATDNLNNASLVTASGDRQAPPVLPASSSSTINTSSAHASTTIISSPDTSMYPVPPASPSPTSVQDVLNNSAQPRQIEATATTTAPSDTPVLQKQPSSLSTGTGAVAVVANSPAAAMATSGASIGPLKAHGQQPSLLVRVLDGAWVDDVLQVGVVLGLLGVLVSGLTALCLMMVQQG